MGLLPLVPGAMVKPVHDKPAERRILRLGEYEKLFAVEWLDVRYKAARLFSAAALRDFVGHRQKGTTERYHHVTDKDREAMHEIQAKTVLFMKAQQKRSHERCPAKFIAATTMLSRGPK